VAVSFVYLSLLTAALVVIQCMIGGTRLAYSFPAYAIAGVAAVLSIVSIRRPAVRPSSFCLGSALLLAGYVVVRAWYSPNAFLARADAFMAAACLIVYLLTALYLAESRFRNWILGALLLVALVHLGVGAYQFKTGDGGYMLFGFIGNTGYGSRAHGMLICPNHLAGFLEAVGMLGLGITFWGRFRVPMKLLIGYITLLCFLGVAITGSRGGYLSSVFALLAFAGLSLWIVRIYQRERFLLTLLGTLVALASVLAITVTLMMESQPIKERLNRVGTASQDVRWYNWLASIDQFKMSPVVGTGAGTHLYYGRLFRRPQLQFDPEHSHGDYLEMLAEYGAVGEVLAFFFLIAHCACGIRTAREVTLRRLCNSFGLARSDTLALTLGGMGAVAAIAVHSLVDFNLHIPGNALLFAFIFGMLASPGTNPPTKLRIGSLEALLRGGLVLLGVGLLVAIAALYPAAQLSNQARLALEAREYPECIKLASRAAEKDSMDPWNYFYQGEANRATGADMPSYAIRESYFVQAIAAYRSGLKLFPEDENLWVRLGQCLDATFQFEEADEAYRAAIANDPTLGILYVYYGAHLRLTGDTEGAQRCEDAAHYFGAEKGQESGMGVPPSLESLRKEAAPPPSK